MVTPLSKDSPEGRPTELATPVKSEIFKILPIENILSYFFVSLNVGVRFGRLFCTLKLIS
jgi:hypothetical protein